MSFRFLNFTELYNNTIQHISTVLESHHKEKKKLGANRNKQIEKICELLDTIKLVEKLNQDQTRQIRKELYDLNLNIRCINKSISQLQSPELTEEQQNLLKQTIIEKKKFERQRNALRSLRNKYHAKSTDSNEFLLSEEFKSLLVTGAWLAIKKEIEKEYQGVINNFLARFIENNAQNSHLYRGIDSKIGIHEGNKMTKGEEKKALDTYQHFAVINELKEKFKSPLNLKHVNTILRDEKPPRFTSNVSAVLPNGLDAKNKIYDTSENIYQYLNGTTVYPDKNNKSVPLNKNEQKKAYELSLSFLNNTKKEIEKYGNLESDKSTFPLRHVSKV